MGALIAVLLLLTACSSSHSEDVVLASDPASLVAGESITANVTSSIGFFEGDLDAAVTSDSGLLLSSLSVQDKRTAIAVISAENALIGPHELLIEMGGEEAVLRISVLENEPGPGTITCDTNTATAGAYHATMTIFGQGTNFDSQVEFQVEGADGFQIVSTDLHNAGWIDITYDIDLDQEPTQATVVLVDGPNRYEIPFSILEATELSSTVTGQTLTKGRVGHVVLRSSQASLHDGTRFQVEDTDVETGDAQVVDETDVSIPVRVPFDYSGNTLSLVAYTYSNGGAILETMNVEVGLLEPAYFAVTPSRLTNTSGTQTVDITAFGTDLTTATSLEMEADPDVTLASWQATSATEGQGIVSVSSGASSGGYALTLDDGDREIFSNVAILGSGKNLFESEEHITAGDQIYMTFVVYGGDLVNGDITLIGDDDITVSGITFIDQGCALARLDIDPGAIDGLATMTLTSDGENYDIYLIIDDAGL